MKRTISLLLLLVLVLAMTACGTAEPSKEPENNNVPASTNAPANTTEAPAKVEIPSYPLDSSLGLSDSILDGQLAIEGVVYQMPIAMSEMEANGWSYDFSGETLEPGAFGMIHFSKDGLSFTAKVVNEYSAAKRVSECHVVSMTFGPQTSDVAYYYTSGGQLVNVQFTSSVNVSTTKEELIAALGESHSTSFLTWRGDNAKYINPGLSFTAYYNDDGTMNQMVIEYLPADFQP